MKGRLVFLLLSVIVLAFACGPRTHAADPAAQPRLTKPRAPEHGAASIAAALDVKLTDGVRFDFHVTNTTARKLEVSFPNGQTHELVVLDSLGKEVWRWSAGRIFTQTLQNKVLRASDSLNYELRWPGATAGHYVAVATLSSVNFPVEQRTEFVVR
jgi:hypothetical protein